MDTVGVIDKQVEEIFAMVSYILIHVYVLLVSGFRGRGRRKVRSVFDGFRDFQAEAGKCLIEETDNLPCSVHNVKAHSSFLRLYALCRLRRDRFIFSCQSV